MEKKLNTLLQNEAFVEELLAQENDTDVQTLFAKNDIEISLDEIANIKASISAHLSDNDELSDNDLENVVGGISINTVTDSSSNLLQSNLKTGTSINTWIRRR